MLKFQQINKEWHFFYLFIFNLFNLFNRKRKRIELGIDFATEELVFKIFNMRKFVFFHSILAYIRG